MTYRVLSGSDRQKVILLVLFLGLALAYSFLPTSVSLFQSLARIFGWRSVVHSELGKMLAFPALSLLFYVSLPKSGESEGRGKSRFREAALLSVLPLSIGFLFGFFHSSPSLFETVATQSGRLTVLWFLLLAPLGEELLFRGWLYRLAERFWPQLAFTATNPLPTSVWATAIAFSLWHFQNFGHEFVYFVLFQVVYTLFAGLWLGYLRFRTGRVWVPIVAHTLLNLASSIL